MSKSQHRSGEPQRAANQGNQMSDDPADGDRRSFTLGKDGQSPAEKKPPNDTQEQSDIEAFGEEGAGIAAKE